MTAPHVYLAVGHGIRPDGKLDPGAVDGKLTEQNTCDIIVSRAAKKLRSWGFRVTDEAYQDDPNYVGTTKRANALKVNLVVAAHRDWNRGVRGVFGFHHPTSEQGKKALHSIVNACAREGFDIARPWVKARGDLYLLKRTAAPAVLMEYGRVQDYNTGELLALGDHTAAGIAAYFGVKPGTTTLADPDDGFDPKAAANALLAIKDLVDVPVGRYWSDADYGRIVAGVRKAVSA